MRRRHRCERRWRCPPISSLEQQTANLQANSERFSFQLAINVPVSVQAPPASQIIDKDALTRIERRRQRRERIRQIRECQSVSRHSKHKLDCAHLRAGGDSGALLASRAVGQRREVVGAPARKSEQ